MRMTIEWFDSESKQSTDLPWIREYLDSGNPCDEATNVFSIYVCPTGLLVLTEFWKGFVYPKSKTHTQLSEALPAYISASELLPRLVVCASASAKLRFGLDKSILDVVWVRHNREYTQMIGEYGTDHSAFRAIAETNPLLPPIPTNGRTSSKNGTHPTTKRSKSES